MRLKSENLLISKIVETGKRLSFYPKVKTSETFEFDVFQKAVDYVIRERGVREKDFKIFAKNLEPVLLKTDRSVFQREDVQRHLVFSLARTVSLTRSFENSGKQIFYVTGPFIQLLDKTDFPQDVRVEMFKLPYPSFYLHLEGLRSELKSEIGTLLVEDLFISGKETDSSFTFEIVFIEKIEADSFMKIMIGVRGGVAFSHMILEIDKEKTLGDLFNFLRLKIQEVLSEKSLSPEELELLNLETMVLLYERISRILINLILYLSHIREDIEEVEKPPAGLLKKKEYYEEIGNEKKLSQIQRQLNKYTKLYLVGKRTRSYPGSHSGRGSSKKPHWRRGHIRYLKHERFKKDWTFVKPTLVGVKSDEERIYRI